MQRIYSVVVCFCFCLGALQAQDTVQHIVPGRTNDAAQTKKHYVILISADGFRYDLADRYNARNLLKFRKQGVQAEFMQPVFPSLTFPNHYSIATGLYPAHHGLVDNHFYDAAKHEVYSMNNPPAVRDSSWYGGTPLWVMAEKQGMLTACFYWVGSEAAIQGIRPTYYYHFNNRIPMDTRIRTVRNWLALPEEKRPHLILFYMPEVDHQAHLHRVDSKETEQAVHFVDESIGKLVRAVDSLHLPVDFIFLSDHGMLNIDRQDYIRLPAALDTSQFRVVYSPTLVHLYAYHPKDILPTEIALKSQAIDYSVFLPGDFPPDWHYNPSDDVFNRVGDIVLVSHAPKVFNFSRHPLNRGAHGFDPSLTDMHACFYAWGPDFKKHYRIPGFENINVYPLVAKILRLSHPVVDGKLRVLRKVLE